MTAPALPVLWKMNGRSAGHHRHTSVMSRSLWAEDPSAFVRDVCVRTSMVRPEQYVELRQSIRVNTALSDPCRCSGLCEDAVPRFENAALLLGQRIALGHAARLE